MLIWQNITNNRRISFTMKRIISFVLAFVMVLAITIPCLAADSLTESNGVWTAVNNGTANWKSITGSKHYKITGNFYDKNTNSNGCCGFAIYQSGISANIYFGVDGYGKFGYTAWGKWWGPSFTYTVTEDRIAHIEVEVIITDDDAIFKASCNDRVLDPVSLKSLIANGDSKQTYSDKSVFTPNRIDIWEKINGGTITDLTFTEYDNYGFAYDPETDEYISYGDQWMNWKKGIISKHYKVSGDFYDLNNGENGFCGFGFGENDNNGAKAILFGVSGASNPGFGWTAWDKWWGSSAWDDANRYTATSDRFAHIEVEVTVTDDDVKFKASCNDFSFDVISLKALIESGGKYEGLSLFTPNTININEKIKYGTVKNLKFTDLELYNNVGEWISGENDYRSPDHTNGNNFEYCTLGQGNTVSISHKFVKDNTAQAGVMLGMLDVNYDHLIKESDDRYYYVCANSEGTWVGIERNDCAWGNFAASKGGLTINNGDIITYTFKRNDDTTVTITVAVNGTVVLTYTDNDAGVMTGTQYAFCSKGVTTFILPGIIGGSNSEWTFENGVYTAPSHTHGSSFEYQIIDVGNKTTLDYYYKSSHSASQAGVMFGIADCNHDGTITENGDQYYYVTVAENGTIIRVERNDKAWGGWKKSVTGLSIAEGDLLTFTFDKIINTITVSVNGEKKFEYTDNWGNYFIGNGYAFCSKGVAEFELPKCQFKSQSLVLSGKIGVNFFVDIPEIEGLYLLGSRVEFTVNDKKTVANIDENFKNADGYYGFTCYVNAIQMAETIHAELKYIVHGETITVVNEYSVKDYIEAFMADTTASYYETYAPMVRALADYGHFVQPFLSDYNGWALGTDYQEMDVYYAEGDYDYASIKTAAEAYKAEITPSEEITNIKYTLSFDSGTDIFVKFTPVSGYTGTVTFKVNGAEAEAEARDNGSYVLKITGISAHKLGDTYTVTAETANGTATVKVSAMSYVYTILNAYEDNVTYKNAVCAFYKYYEAAKALINAD